MHSEVELGHKVQNVVELALHVLHRPPGALLSQEGGADLHQPDRIQRRYKMIFAWQCFGSVLILIRIRILILGPGFYYQNKM